MYINAPDYLATCTKIEKFIKVMQDPMTESIRLKVKIPFTVCLRISKVLQRRDNAFVDLATRYNNMDPRELGIESDSLSQLHRMLGEIAATSRQSGITALSGNVSASAAHVSSGMTEFTAAAVKVSGPHWAGRKNTQTRDKTGSDNEGKYECAAEGCTKKLTINQSTSIDSKVRSKKGKMKAAADHQSLCDHHFDLLVSEKSVKLKPGSDGKPRDPRISNKQVVDTRKQWKANRVKVLTAYRVELDKEPTAANDAGDTDPALDPDMDDTLSEIGSVSSAASNYIQVPSNGRDPGFVLDSETGSRYYSETSANLTPPSVPPSQPTRLSEASEPRYTLSEIRELQTAAATQHLTPGTALTVPEVDTSSSSMVARPGFHFPAPSSRVGRSG